MNRKSFDFDLITLSLYALLVFMGWLTIYAVTSATGTTDPLALHEEHGRQLMWVGISLAVGFVVLMLDIRFIEGVSYVAYGLALVLLVVVLFAGKEVNGAKSWLIIGGVQLQPSEFAKLATALALSRYMSSVNFSLSNTRQFLTAALIVLLPAAIIIGQNDTGSALVFGSFIFVFFREGLNPLVPILLLLVAAVVIMTLGIGNQLITAGIITGMVVLVYVLTFNRRQAVRSFFVHGLALALFLGLSFGTSTLVSKLKPHQQKRIMVLFNPEADPQGAGYNVIQSKIAIGSGGLTGKGFLQGSYTKYKFVPKQETDFIFCTVGEEFGWIGTTAVILLFALLLFRLRFMAENAKTRFSRIYGYSVLSILFFHVMVNIGMTIGLVPVIGIPLPFFSYGGSSLLAFSVLLAIMVNLYSYRVSILGSKS
ncbi:MAG: rod shape-determining protein RodA [Bacteroidetes bacterium]|nr:MAG: rod shape-determining protein RodA [Bacteroidota bacterium]